MNTEYNPDGLHPQANPPRDATDVDGTFTPALPVRLAATSASSTAITRLPILALRRTRHHLLVDPGHVAQSSRASSSRPAWTGNGGCPAMRWNAYRHTLNPLEPTSSQAFLHTYSPLYE